MRLGVISDTHGLLRPRVFDLFAGVDRILHAGDVGDPAILDDLEAIAPVLAVWGNVDGPELRARLPERLEVELAGVRVGMAHGHREEPAYEALAGTFPDAALIVHGHSHLPRVGRAGRALLLNPGSAGPRRFGRPATVALLELGPAGIEARHLDAESGSRLRP